MSKLRTIVLAIATGSATFDSPLSSITSQRVHYAVPDELGSYLIWRFRHLERRLLVHLDDHKQQELECILP